MITSKATTVTVEIPARTIAAALVVTPKSDVRGYLNGVHLTSNGRALYAVATDGHRLVAARVECPIGTPEFAVILPHDACKTIAKDRADTAVTVSLDTSAGTFTVARDSQTIVGDLIDGKFPDWRRVVPTEYNGQPAQFNVKYLADLAKIKAAYTGKTAANARHDAITVYHNGTDAARVSFGDDQLVAVVMPMRGENVAEGGSLAPFGTDPVPTFAGFDLPRAHFTLPSGNLVDRLAAYKAGKRAAATDKVPA